MENSEQGWYEDEEDEDYIYRGDYEGYENHEYCEQHNTYKHRRLMPLHDQPTKVHFDEILHQTEKAYLILSGEQEVWLPISETKIHKSLNGNYAIIPWWLVKQAELLGHIVNLHTIKKSKGTLREKLSGG